MSSAAHCVWLEHLSMVDLPNVGGKNSSLGEMIANLSSVGIKVPLGFATTATAYQSFLTENNLQATIKELITDCNVDDVSSLQACGSQIRAHIIDANFSDEFIQEITTFYNQLVEKCGDTVTFAVRSSATAEDLPTASFAGQQETFLNVVGIDNIITKIKDVYASLFTDRAISYRVHHGFEHMDVAISVGIQQMVRSDEAASGVMFTLDTDSGYDGVVYITSSYGLGEAIVGGAVNPDEFYVDKKILSSQKPAIIRKHKGSKAIKMVYGDTGIITTDVNIEASREFSLTNPEIEKLATYAMLIENHYKIPMDIEWAKDGINNELYILQARPETVQSGKSKQHIIEKYSMEDTGNILVTGRSVGNKIGSGPAKIFLNIDNMHTFVAGDVLVTDMTDPDWEPIMKKASAIVTNRGGRTCHAAIIARELGIPAIVGAEKATRVIEDGSDITVSCAEGDEGKVYQGILKYSLHQHELSNMPSIPVDIMLNIGNPDNAFKCHNLPVAGVGLARLEFIINNNIGIHPNAILAINDMPIELQDEIYARTCGYADPKSFYEQKLIEGIATIASVFNPRPVIFRLSDFKSNEYENLIGGKHFEPHEENPMIGFRGAARYLSADFKACFAMECNAIKYVRKVMGLTNVKIMVPFVRTLQQAQDVIALLKEFGLESNKDNLQIYMMCEVPSNVILAKEFLQYFDGFSIGSNDLTQLTLGLDRDSAGIAHLFDERDLAIKTMLANSIKIASDMGKYVGICGQAPSDYLDFATWLMEQGIHSMSLNPDSVVNTILALSEQ